MPLRLTELVMGYPYHSRSPSADTTPAADDDLLPRPRFSTRQYSALFVRVETELPDAKAAKPKPHPLRLVSDALKSEVEHTDICTHIIPVASTLRRRDGKETGYPLPLRASQRVANQMCREIAVLE